MTDNYPIDQAVLDFYARQTRITSPGSFSHLYEGLPREIPELCQVLQNILIHMWWIRQDTYGFTLHELREAGRDVIAEISLSTAENRLSEIQRLEPTPLTSLRRPASRSVGNCRDFSVMLVSILRHRGIPARARTGTTRYFYPDGGKLEDHWICEFWNDKECRWQQADAQIDRRYRSRS